MKLALLSDIHSNVFALEAVIEDAKRHAVDRLINLGDILYGPIAPRATYELLLKHEFVTISGNQDRQIYEASGDELYENPTMAFIHEDLGEEPIAWMKSLPFDYQLTDEVYLCHGTPNNDLIYLLENVESGSACLRTDSEIMSLLNGQQSKLICCGHTHTPRTVSLSNGQIVVNPGSVGLQAYSDDEPCVHSMENFTDMASYAIIEKVGDDWTVQHLKVPYDVSAAVTACDKRNRKDWAHYLMTGRRL